jgi:hypothetical protein
MEEVGFRSPRVEHLAGPRLDARWDQMSRGSGDASGGALRLLQRLRSGAGRRLRPAPDPARVDELPRENVLDRQHRGAGRAGAVAERRARELEVARGERRRALVDELSALI